MQPPEEQPSHTTSFGMTIVYNHWFPLFHLGHLLPLLLERTVESRARPTTWRTQPINQTMNQSMNQNNMNPPNFCMSAMHANVGFFMEEHKMKDVATATANNNYNKCQSFLSPNQFDAGYGKYMDPLA
jgi:hypothetical protein